MRAVVTRVNSARVTRAETGEVLGEIGKGFLVLLGVHVDDTEKEAAKIADRICGLRVFEDAITFKIALMVAKYMKYMESLDY